MPLITRQCAAEPSSGAQKYVYFRVISIDSLIICSVAVLRALEYSHCMASNFYWYYTVGGIMYHTCMKRFAHLVSIEAKGTDFLMFLSMTVATVILM